MRRVVCFTKGIATRSCIHELRQRIQTDPNAVSDIRGKCLTGASNQGMLLIISHMDYVTISRPDEEPLEEHMRLNHPGLFLILLIMHIGCNAFQIDFFEWLILQEEGSKWLSYGNSLLYIALINQFRGIHHSNDRERNQLNDMLIS